MEKNHVSDSPTGMQDKASATQGTPGQGQHHLVGTSEEVRASAETGCSDATRWLPSLLNLLSTVSSNTLLSSHPVPTPAPTSVSTPAATSVPTPVPTSDIYPNTQPNTCLDIHPSTYLNIYTSTHPNKHLSTYYNIYTPVPILMYPKYSPQYLPDIYPKTHPNVPSAQYLPKYLPQNPL